MTADAGEVDRVLWQGASDTSRAASRLIGSVLAPMLTAIIVTAGVLFVTGLMDAPGAWVIAVIFLVLVLLQTVRTLLKRRPQEQRFTLTERQFIVESDGGRQAYDLGQLGDLTVEARADGMGDIGFPSAPHPLARDVPDASALLHRIEAARADLMEAKATSDALDQA